MSNKIKVKNKIRCSICHSPDIRAKGRVYGNVGKKEFECGSCGHTYQYGGGFFPKSKRR